MKLINQTQTKRFLIEYAKANRHHGYTQVSKETLQQAEYALIRWLQKHVMSSPSKGKTL